ncbi:hypothetical protein BVX95_01630 [archaeon D22]|nr:hypothetical protein BVX95_01630 [archaeon D22]
MDNTTKISTELNLLNWQVKNVLDMMSEDNTVHFIARYRKEKTGNLDENEIRSVIELNEKIVKLEKARESAIKNIDEQGKLTEELKSKILACKTIQEVEDIYEPYKRTRKTKADVAMEKGFGVVSKQIRFQQALNIPKHLLEKYSKEEIISGAQDIISQEIADNPSLKEFVRSQYFSYGIISSKFKKLDEKAEKESYKFEIYRSFSQNINKLKSYQILALNRGEDLNILSVSLEKDEVFFERFEKRLIKSPQNQDLLKPSVKEGYNKIFSSIEREVRSKIRDVAEEDAIKVFQENLKNLLMLKPHYNSSILAVDPGFRTGCKICVLDKNGTPKKFSKFYIEKGEDAKRIIESLISEVDVVVVGNGTGSDEAQKILSEFNKPIIVMNESGASVYSTSKIGNEEFPNLDATERGTVSIGRRYIDSLSELVKVPVTSIGVGMYQHDITQKQLEQKLKETVEDVVNLVGINVNSASPYLLSYISGLNIRSAIKIFEKRPYKSREELGKVLSKKAFEQSIGFLRVPQSSEELDNTAVHPEQYELARIIINHLKQDVNSYIDELKKLNSDVTIEIVNDIIENIRNSKKEFRENEGILSRKKSLKIEDLSEGDIIEGVIRNVTQFGAFVDIGIKNDALIHISHLANKFVKDPLEVVSIGEEVRAKVIAIDVEKGRVNLSLKEV